MLQLILIIGVISFIQDWTIVFGQDTGDCLGSGNNKKLCQYTNLPDKTFHSGSVLSMLYYIKTETGFPTKFECGVRCAEIANSKSCGYNAKNGNCHMFNKEFDETEIALQLNFGWTYIYHKDDNGYKKVTEFNLFSAANKCSRHKSQVNCFFVRCYTIRNLKFYL